MPLQCKYFYWDSQNETINFKGGLNGYTHKDGKFNRLAANNTKK